jgi:hypothetical protein
MLKIPDLLVFVTPLFFSSALLAALHWFPWNGGEQQLSRLEAYMVGTSVVVGVPVLTMLLVTTLDRSYPEPFWASLLLANSAVSGVTIGGAYWYDSKRPIEQKNVDDATRRR